MTIQTVAPTVLIRGTTPTISLVFPQGSVDFSETSHVYVTFTNDLREQTLKDGELTINGTTISVSLTQKQTLAMRKAETEVQVNWTYADGTRGASEIAVFSMSRNLLNEVLE